MMVTAPEEKCTDDRGSGGRCFGCSSSIDLFLKMRIVGV